ncbi:MAG: RNB domain-containing ribonuclease, partial [Desulfovibrio sp.]|nr:RNB domain-containing ribonuclease [Desulfovibrio sp.]
MLNLLRYPSAGCIIEYLEGNNVHIAMVLGVSGDRLRVILHTRREVTLGKNRCLPWIGPQCSGNVSREEAVRLLEEHKAKRESLLTSIPILDVWSLAQGEVREAQVEWLCELVESDPDEDQLAAYGQALLNCKTHFRFHPPCFQIFSAEEVEKRESEQQKNAQRKALFSGGQAFFQFLWEVAQGRKKLNEPLKNLWPTEEVAEQLEALLRSLMLKTEDQETENLWSKLSKGLPELPNLPLQLLQAWEKVPPHYNVQLAIAEYDPSAAWWEGDKGIRDGVEELFKQEIDLWPLDERQFISIDSASTQDIDDAFSLIQTDSGWQLTVALAAHAAFWTFDSALDMAVRKRATSLYLPEGTYHMLPECLG